MKTVAEHESRYLGQNEMAGLKVKANHHEQKAFRHGPSWYLSQDELSSLILTSRQSERKS